MKLKLVPLTHRVVCDAENVVQIITSDKVKTQAEQSAGVGCEAVPERCSLMGGQPV
jgi:hypothetical protein